MRGIPVSAHYLNMASPWDQHFKILGDSDARGTLAAFGQLPLDAPAVVTKVGREVMPARRVDQAYRVEHDGKTLIHHFEATTSYYYVKLEDVFDYSILLEMQHKIGVFTKIVIMTSRGMPDDPPAVFHLDRGGSNARTHRVDYVCVWKVPARVALSQNRLAILPWVALMDASDQEEYEAQHRIAASDQAGTLAGYMAMLYGLRYREEEARRRISKMYELLTEEMMLESSMVQRWLRQGREEGRKEGGTIAVTKLVRTILTSRFGEIPDWAESRLQEASLESLEEWTIRMMHATTLEDVLLRP